MNEATQQYLKRYPAVNQEILSALTELYTVDELKQLPYPEVFFTPTLRHYGKPVEILYLFGGLNGFQSAVSGLVQALSA